MRVAKTTSESPCKKCARCCRRLILFERLQISIYTRSLILSAECKHLTEDNLCSIYGDRHQLCIDWKCGVFIDQEDELCVIGAPKKR